MTRAVRSIKGYVWGEQLGAVSCRQLEQYSMKQPVHSSLSLAYRLIPGPHLLVCLQCARKMQLHYHWFVSVWNKAVQILGTCISGSFFPLYSFSLSLILSPFSSLCLCLSLSLSRIHFLQIHSQRATRARRWLLSRLSCLPRPPRGLSMCTRAAVHHC